MKIAVDVMGGDFAPRELVLGCKSFFETGKAGVVMVGAREDILEIWPDVPDGVEIYDTPEFVEMGEPPAQALRRKKNASVAVAARLVKDGEAAAFLSAGSTGAQMAASLLKIGRIKGIERPGVSVLLPTSKDYGVMVLDVGANVDCRPVHLFQFALMGAAYYEKICGIPNPRVGLLNVGSEAGKGNDLTKAVYALLQESSLNFIGHVEADHLYSGQAHVVVCDGFAGNVLLKTSEGLASLILGTVRQAVQTSGVSKEGAGGLLKAMQRFQPGAPEYSGAPLLGIAGGAIVCHGNSKAPVIANALDLAARYAATDVIGLISHRLAEAHAASPGAP